MYAVVNHSIVLKDVTSSLVRKDQVRVKVSTSACIGIPYDGEEMF